MNFAEIGKAMGKDPRDAAMDLVIADKAESSVIISIMHEDDVRGGDAHAVVSFDTDSGARAEDGPLSESKSHPRAWGTFTRVLGHYVRERAAADARGGGAQDDVAGGDPRRPRSTAACCAPACSPTSSCSIRPR